MQQGQFRLNKVGKAGDYNLAMKQVMKMPLFKTKH